MNTNWIAVDLDGTLAHYDGWVDTFHIGKPIPTMINRVRKWLSSGMRVKIFTARVAVDDAVLRENIVRAIEAWCAEHIGTALEITNQKDQHMIELWDDRCVPVERNTGKRLLPLKGFGEY